MIKMLLVLYQVILFTFEDIRFRFDWWVVLVWGMTLTLTPFNILWAWPSYRESVSPHHLNDVYMSQVVEVYNMVLTN